jgi:uncharacterized protein (TIGR00725 family)
MQVAVIGAGSCDVQTAAVAEELGKLLAEAGHDVICGGMGGVMESVCRGAFLHGGKTVGILPGPDTRECNSYLTVKIATGMGIGRNIIIIRSADAVIAVAGKYGTLSEIAFALQLEKPVIAINSWEVSDEIMVANDAHEAIRFLAKI